jgi:hypothetical protein
MKARVPSEDGSAVEGARINALQLIIVAIIPARGGMVARFVACYDLDALRQRNPELESATGLQFLPEFGALPQDFKSEVDPLFFQN